jgi:hypothetical protein
MMHGILNIKKKGICGVQVLFLSGFKSLLSLILIDFRQRSYFVHCLILCSNILHAELFFTKLCEVRSELYIKYSNGLNTDKHGSYITNFHVIYNIKPINSLVTIQNGQKNYALDAILTYFHIICTILP